MTGAARETSFKKWVKAKFNPLKIYRLWSPNAGVPDYYVVLDKHTSFFVEVKYKQGLKRPVKSLLSKEQLKFFKLNLHNTLLAFKSNLVGWGFWRI